MKKLIKTIIVVLLVIPVSSLFAASSGLPGVPLKNMEFSTGIGLSYIYRPLENPQGYVDNVRSFQLILKGGMGLTDYINVFLIGGMNDANKEIGDFKGTLSPFYGLGLRLIPMREDVYIINLSLEMDFTYSKISGIVDTGNTNLYWSKFDFKLGASKFIDNYLGIYGGLKYSYQIIKMAGQDTSKSQVPWGIYIGADYFVTPYVFFEVEMHNFDQDALFMLVGAKF